MCVEARAKKKGKPFFRFREETHACSMLYIVNINLSLQFCFFLHDKKKPALGSKKKKSCLSEFTCAGESGLKLTFQSD